MSLKLDFIHVRVESCNRDILLHPTELDLNQNPWRRSSGRVPRLFFRFQSQQIVKVWPPGKLRNHIQQQYPNLKKKKLPQGAEHSVKLLFTSFLAALSSPEFTGKTQKQSSIYKHVLLCTVPAPNFTGRISTGRQESTAAPGNCSVHSSHLVKTPPLNLYTLQWLFC